MKLKGKHYVLLVLALIAGGGAGLVIDKAYSPQPAPQISSTSTGSIVNPRPYGNRVGPGYLYPDPIKTPGAVNPDIRQANIKQNICNPAWSTRSIRPPASYTSGLKAKQLANGYAYEGDTNPADYEEDHLISLEVGGNPTDQKNLWPEPYHTQVNGVEVGAHQKDAVENQVHKEICAGTITLARGQEILSHDWYACFLQLKNPAASCL